MDTLVVSERTWRPVECRLVFYRHQSLHGIESLPGIPGGGDGCRCRARDGLRDGGGVQGHLQRSRRMVEEMLDNGATMLVDMSGQRERLKVATHVCS